MGSSHASPGGEYRRIQGRFKPLPVKGGSPSLPVGLWCQDRLGK